MTLSARHQKMKAHSEKLMNVSDMQVPDEDDHFAGQPPPHDRSDQARSRKSEFGRSIPVSPANSKIVIERIWINPVTSKIMVQPLESDTDAQLHEERVISVRKRAEIGISISTRENVPDEMRTSWKLFDMTKFQEEIKIAQKTAATSHVP